MKAIKLFTLILFAAALFQSTSLLAVTTNNGRQARPLTGFHGISVTSGIDLYLSQKNVEEVFIEADADDLDKIITTVEDGILKIYIKDKAWWGNGWNNRPRKAYVSFKTLDKLHASAGADVNGESIFKFDKLECDASSGSDMKLELEANELHVGISSGSDITLKGKAKIVRFEASSGSDLDAGELESQKCHASVSSGSDIRVNVTDELDAEASSAGDITYLGNPKTKNIHKSSGGDVTQR